MTLDGKNPPVFIAGINALTPEAPGSSQNFVSRLATQGFNVTFNLDSAEYFVCVDHSSSDLRSARRAGITRERSILIRNEPTVVSPQNRDSVVKHEYGLILDVGRPASALNNSLPWPQQWPKSYLELRDVKNRKDRVVMINANKISFLKGELYSLRRAACRHLDSLDLFGQGWNMSLNEKLKHYLSNLWIALKSGQRPRFSGGKYFLHNTANWKGAPEDKREIALRYKYSLVIENSKEFITEKFFDALFSGCIPVYVGPNLEEFNIPNNLYVKAENNLEDISQKIKSLHEIDYGKWRAECSDWLSGYEVRSTWKSENVNLEIIKQIREFMQDPH